MEIRVMARRGMRIREIARELACSRNTVKRYLRDAKVSRYGPRQPRGTKLDPGCVPGSGVEVVECELGSSARVASYRQASAGAAGSLIGGFSLIIANDSRLM